MSTKKMIEDVGLHRGAAAADNIAADNVPS